MSFLPTLVALFLVTQLPAAGSAGAGPLPGIDTSGFRDGAHHWRKIRDKNRVIQPMENQPAYTPDQVREIATNISAVPAGERGLAEGLRHAGRADRRTAEPADGHPLRHRHLLR